MYTDLINALLLIAICIGAGSIAISVAIVITGFSFIKHNNTKKGKENGNHKKN